ncbi:glycoside hydrolase family 2 protein [Undibacterium sp. SXout7W]|uniref:glycoside hydrolase family 2 protein n=1 Tax=Undibacterium sp. SXout7W TaxID=3413049 RepID=UPI003BF262B4
MLADTNNLVPPFRRALDTAWQMTLTAADAATQASALTTLPLTWQAASVPATVASVQRDAGTFQYGAHHLDDLDAWFRCELDIPEAAYALHFEGLASLAEVYWNDRCILRSDNMFTEHRLLVAEHELHGHGVLCVRFASVNQALKQRRPRPRWKTKLVEQQQLRWLRTSLLGRMPGWSPPVAPVGPYRPVWLEMHRPLRVEHLRLQGLADADLQCRIDLHCRIHVQPHQLQENTAISKVILHLDDQQYVLDGAEQQHGYYELCSSIAIPDAQLWWPHTHGAPRLYRARLEIQCQDQQYIEELGHIGFRHLQLHQQEGDFHLHLNGTSVFCRGACWTPADFLSLNADRATVRRMLQLARNAGMNMLRVVGTMVYETRDFYQLCDELGIMVWQDMMFANMDYPVSDPAFSASITEEARQFLSRTQARACITVICGNSEIEQQAAMLGQAPALWSNIFFQETLPLLCSSIRPDAVYWPSSPSGGVMPFQIDAGVAHYFGVGAYLRPPEDARRCGVRFTSECLGLSNMPDDALIDQMLGNGESPGPHPAWKRGVPRDNGTGWDFEDVRDHYMAQLYQVDPVRLRYADRERYLALARTTSGEVMSAALNEWRRTDSGCHGALVWFWRDLWPGAGWGVIDANGQPKAAYYYLRRAMLPLTVLITDEGLNGLFVHIANDTPMPFDGELELCLLRHGDISVAKARIRVNVAAHSTRLFRADALLPHFADTSYAYRFGPQGHHAAIAHLYHADTPQPFASATFFPNNLALPQERDLGLQAQLTKSDSGDYILSLRTEKLAQSVYVQISDFLVEDNYFHLTPGVEKQLVLLPLHAETDKIPKGTAQALNAQNSVKIQLLPH